MKLPKHPKKEMEYWLTIEELGGFIYNTEHDLSHGRVNSTPGILQDIQDAQNIFNQLVDELFLEFGVVAPKDCPRVNFGEKMPDPPFGFKWYWQWYREMKEKAYREEYDNIICSACPMSEGIDAYIDYRSIPCSEWKGVLYRLVQPFLCAKVSFDKWTEDKFVEKIVEKGGLEALKAYNAKKRELITKFAVAGNKVGKDVKRDEIDDFVDNKSGKDVERDEIDDWVDQALSHIAQGN